MKMKISITGSSGAIGKPLSQFLTKKKIVIQKIPKKLLHDELELKDKFDKFNPDIIIHLAGNTNPLINNKSTLAKYFKDNVISTLNVANCAPKKTKLLFFGSIEEYGSSKLPYSEDNQLNPNSFYGWSKYSAFLIIQIIFKNYPNKYLWIRPCLVAAKNTNKNRLFGLLEKNKNKFIPNHPKNIRDFISIENLIDIVYFLISNTNTFQNNSLNISLKNYYLIEDLLKFLFNGEKLNKYPLSRGELKNENNDKIIINDNKRLRKIFPNKLKNNFISFLKKNFK